MKRFRTVVSDAGPLISFEKIPNGFGMLRRVVERVLIPSHVLEEVTVGLPTGTDYLDHFQLADFASVVVPPAPPDDVQHLQMGERYAIALALSEQTPLLIEDWEARQVADRLGLFTVGALGLLIQGYRDSMISTDEFSTAIMAMRKAGRISQALLEKVRQTCLGH